MQKGIFFVIDGTDGAGKATQTALLIERLKTEGRAVETISFPQYGKKSAGSSEEYLEGKYGSAKDVGPYKASVFYAVDRFDAASQINAWLEEGSIVIADRYVGSNMGHQGSKILDAEERKKFFNWAMHFEYEVMGIPKPDINFVLHVPTEVTLELTKDRELKSNLSHDVHEKDAHHLKTAEETYIEITKQFSAFKLIECMKNEQLSSPQTIHEIIWNYAKTYLNRTNNRRELESLSRSF